MALKKSDIKPPVLRKQAVAVPELGGEVVVRALKLSERLALFDGIDGEGRSFAHIARLLAVAVVDADGKPVFGEEEWDTFAAQAVESSMALFDAAKRISGLDAEVVAKN